MSDQSTVEIIENNSVPDLDNKTSIPAENTKPIKKDNTTLLPPSPSQVRDAQDYSDKMW